MATEKGLLTTCDRCGAYAFARYMGRGENGGSAYEAIDAGWTRDDIGDLCPSCSAAWQDIKKRFITNECFVF